MPTLKFLAMLFFLVFVSPQAFASPTFLYGFSITSFSCENHPSIDCPQGAASVSVSDWAGPLGKLEIGLNADAISSQHASLLINRSGGLGSINNQGFNSIHPTRWGIGDGALDISANAFTGPFIDYYWLESIFDISEYLTGSLYINNSRDEIFMNTSGSNLWSGFIRSDALGLTTSVLDFTGEWKFMGVVPEPSIIWLLIGAAFATTAIRRKQNR